MVRGGVGGFEFLAQGGEAVEFAVEFTKLTVGAAGDGSQSTYNPGRCALVQHDPAGCSEEAAYPVIYRIMRAISSVG